MARLTRSPTGAVAVVAGLLGAAWVCGPAPTAAAPVEPAAIAPAANAPAPLRWEAPQTRGNPLPLSAGRRAGAPVDATADGAFGADALGQVGGRAAIGGTALEFGTVRDPDGQSATIPFSSDWVAAGPLPDSEFDYLSLREVLSRYINTRENPSAAAEADAAVARLENGAPRGRGDEARPWESILAEEIIAEFVDAVLTARVDEQGSVRFSILGMGDFSIEQVGTDGEIIVSENTYGLRMSTAPERDWETEGIVPKKRRSSGLSPSSVMDTIHDIIEDILSSPLLYAVIAVIGLAVLHTRVRRFRKTISLIREVPRR